MTLISARATRGAFVLCLAAFAWSNVQAAEPDAEPAHHQHHDHRWEPIGVMGAHTHDPGEWMVSYRYMYMAMQENRSNRDDLRNSEVRGLAFPVVPTRMNMQMHMLGGMYGVNEHITLMAMLPIVEIDMDHRAGMPLGAIQFTTRSAGLGDIAVAGLFRLLNGDGHHVHATVGLSLPTGSISVRDDTPAREDARLPYPMRLGSGSLGLLPGITYTGEAGMFSWGLQARGSVPLHENGDGYRVGEEGQFSGWIAADVADVLTLSFRATGFLRANIHGSDPDLNPRMVPTADPDRRAARQIDVAWGISFNAPGELLHGHRLALELSLPVYRDLHGPQLETDWMLTAGWQWAF